MGQEQPIPYDDFMSSQAMRNEAWRRRFALEANFSAARPGRGHRALASLYRAGNIPAVITQNIDNLHQVSGFTSEYVVELHGNTTYATCLLRQRYECRGCVSNLMRRRSARLSGAADRSKTATVSFGQAMPVSAMQRAEELSGLAIFLAIGSSLVVWPAAGFPLMAKRNASALVIINREPTDFDNLADLVIRQDIGDALRLRLDH